MPTFFWFPQSLKDSLWSCDVKCQESISPAVHTNNCINSSFLHPKWSLVLKKSKPFWCPDVTVSSIHSSPWLAGSAGGKAGISFKATTEVLGAIIFFSSPHLASRNSQLYIPVLSLPMCAMITGIQFAFEFDVFEKRDFTSLVSIYRYLVHLLRLPNSHWSITCLAPLLCPIFSWWGLCVPRNIFLIFIELSLLLLLLQILSCYEM